MTSRKYLYLLLSVLIFLPPQQTNSCAFFILDEEYRFWMFNPNLSQLPGSFPFFYTSELYYEGLDKYTRMVEPNPDVQSHKEIFEENINQWFAYTQGKVSKESISMFLYELDPATYFESEAVWLKNNDFLNYSTNHHELLTYLVFAKLSEANINPKPVWDDCPDCPNIINGKVVPLYRIPSYWEMQQEDFPKANTAIVNQGLKLYEQCSDPFLKRRYGYQLVRLAYYALDSITMANVFNSAFANGSKDWMYYDALMYEAMSNTGALKNFKLAQVFKYAPSKRYRCVQLYVQKQHYQEAISLAENNQEQGMVEVMEAIHNPSPCLTYLRHLQIMDPHNAFLPFLWIREINKLEDWILGPQYSEFGSTRSNDLWYQDEQNQISLTKQLLKDKTYAKECLQVLQKQVNLNAANASFYHLCLAYVHFMLKDLTQVQQQLSLVQPETLSNEAKLQYQLTRFMLALSQTSSVNDEIKNTFLQLVQTIQKEEANNYELKSIRYQLISFAAQEFLKRNAAAEGLMLFGKTEKGYAYHPYIGKGNVYIQLFEKGTPEALYKVIEILEKNQKTDFEKYLCGDIYCYYQEDMLSENYELSICKWNPNRVRDILSMKLVQQNKIKAAINVLSRVEPSYWQNETYKLFAKDDPFVVSPWNGHAAMNEVGIKYTKLSFLQQLYHLQSQLPRLKGEEKAKVLYLIGNAYFSMSYDGKYWIAQSNYWSCETEYDTQRPSFGSDYFTPYRAMYYYKEALNCTQDVKLSALIGQALKGINMSEKSFYNDKQILQMLKSRKINTDTYEQLNGNCALFYDFLETYSYFAPQRRQSFAKN